MNELTLEQLRSVAKKLRGKNDSNVLKPIQLTKEQTEILNSNLAYVEEPHKEGDLYYPNIMLDKHNPDML